MSVELLALLNAKIKDIRLLPPGFEHITDQDISFALSFVPGDGPRLLGRIKYADQTAFLASLEYNLYKELKHRARLEKWRNLRPLRALSRLAVSVYTSPKRCKRCRGIGEKKWGAKIIVCPRCEGSTWEPIFSVDFADAIGVSDTRWPTWRKRLGTALDILAGWDDLCIRGFSKALKKFDKAGGFV